MGVKNADGTFTDRCLDRIPVGEPFFVLRAQDKSAVPKIEAWLRENGERRLESTHAAETVALINEMKAWQEDHPDRVKWPD